MAILELEHIGKIYGKSDNAKQALEDVNFAVEKGDFLSIMGPSGSGKSTLLHILGCMDMATEGEYRIFGQNVNRMSEKELSKIRNEKISFVFQNFALLSRYTVYENIELPLNCRKMTLKEKKEKIRYYMERLGIADLSKKLPGQISGGQQQRTAIARAMVTNADVILADEPTGALDRKTSEELMTLLKEINEEGKTIILVTHDQGVADIAKKMFVIEDGRIHFIWKP